MAFPVDIERVKRAETKLGRKLPLSYVDKMCRNNGGEVVAGPDVWQLHPILDDSDKKRLKRTCNDVTRETMVAREWRNFPQDAVAIGANGGGDRLVLLPHATSAQFGDAVFWWDHETGEINQVASTFGELEDADIEDEDDS